MVLKRILHWRSLVVSLIWLGWVLFFFFPLLLSCSLKCSHFSFSEKSLYSNYFCMLFTAACCPCLHVDSSIEEHTSKSYRIRISFIISFTALLYCKNNFLGESGLVFFFFFFSICFKLSEHQHIFKNKCKIAKPR